MKEKYLNFPVFAERVFKILLPEPDLLFLKGDYEEIFNGIFKEKGRFIAYAWIWKQIIKLFCIHIFDVLRLKSNMMKNYFKISFRNMKRHKVFSFINISGLAVGMACSILIFLWVQDELSFDKFHDRSEDIYRLIGEMKLEEHSYFRPNAASQLVEAAAENFARG